MQISEEIKSKLDIVDVIREYVPNLKAVGVNFTALSPFNREKTPSFVVSPEKQIWHCFSSGKGGDMFSFVMEMEGVTFVEALRILAPRAGVELKRENPEVTSKRNRLLDILETAAIYYHKVFLEAPIAQPARDYIYKKRGLTEQTVLDWQIGYSPDSWDDLLNVLKKKSYTEMEILAAGLCIKKEGRNAFYNRFRGRIMFPICDINGNTVAFTARVSPEKEATETMGKYINSPETALYSKSKIVFGLNKAKMEIKSQGYAIVVEGQMDCISCHQAGFKNVVASSGTAFTADQLKLIKRYASNISLAFDMDAAGQLAADRGIREAFTAEMNMKVITIPDGKDPDELIRKDVEAWKKSVANAKHVMQYYFDKTFATHNILESEGKREAAKKILPIISRLPDLIEQDHWLRALAEKLQVSENALRETILKSKVVAKRPEVAVPVRSIEAPVLKRLTREENLTINLLALIVKFPTFFEYIIHRLSMDHIFGVENKAFYRNLIIYYNDISGNSEDGRAEINYQEFRNWLTSQKEGPENEGLFRLLDKIAILGEKDFFGLESDKAKNEVIKIVIALKESYLSVRKNEISRMIRELESDGQTAEAIKLMEELKRLSDETTDNISQLENI